MAVTSVKLVDGATEMVLYPREDLVLKGLDPGSPAVRAQVENRADGDGEVDTTQRRGGRVLTVEFMTLANPEGIMQELGLFLRPSARPYLVRADDEWVQQRRLRLRVDPWAAPLSADLAPWQREVQVQWRCPDGTWEGLDETTVIVGADAPASVGFSAPFSAPLELAPAAATNSAQTANAGTDGCHFVARLYGPCTAPRLINDTTDEQLVFTAALALGAGEYVEVDTLNRTAYLNSDPTLSRLGFVDFPVSTWWQVQPGLNTIRFAPTSPSAGSQAEITYRPLWL